ncbi:hypothetical protein [Azospirillum sp. TSH64]|uniref:hypothetical protein n=1 Tax=Azospirillum sp. TSH64 TaxID=652740 RepID=UPI000D6162E6|nr:hypothetical protein [Azospirillum sp. TSH64]PWC78390.1 hypothetical protein TSH64_29845 [Azospirillum sp. TSH64]
MKVDPEVLNCATGLLHMAREAERSNGWEAGDLLRTTLRLLVVAGADGHGWSATDLSEEVRDLVEAVRMTKGDGGMRFRGGETALH